MKIIKFAVIATLFIVNVVLYAQPKITILPRTILDLGDYYAGQTIETHVTIKNDGSDTLRIKEIKPICGCTATLLIGDKKNLGPSDTVQLSLLLDTKSLTGTVIKSVEIYSNDSLNPKTTIMFAAFIIERLKITPSQIYFYFTNWDSTYKNNVTLKNMSKDLTMNIVSVNPKNENLRAKIGKNKLAPGEETFLEAIFHPTKDSMSQGIIELTTDDPGQKIIFEIKVFSWFKGD
jgi:hypothetical protein